MWMTTKKKKLIGFFSILFLVSSGDNTLAKEQPNPTEMAILEQANHAKYPGHFMKDFLMAFYKKWKTIDTDETALEFTVAFTVTTTGKLDNIIILGLPDAQVTEGTTKLVKEMKKWKPAKKQGLAEEARYTVPFYILVDDLKQGNPNPTYYAKKEDASFKMAQYPTGMDGFWKEFYKINGPESTANFVGDQIKYNITILIQSDGTVTNAELKGIENEKLKEAFLDDFIDVIRRMSKWNPATYDGKPVPSKLTIRFAHQVEILEM